MLTDNINKFKSLVYEQSPWRDKPDWYKTDKTLEELETAVRSKLFHPPNMFYFLKKNFFYKVLKENKNGVKTLQGPRRIGKSSTLKYLIKVLIKDEGYKAKQFLYLSIDKKPLKDLVNTNKGLLAEGLKSIIDESEKPLIIVIDEVTACESWGDEIKSFLDFNIIDGVGIILTGSYSMALTDQISKIRGRGGELEEDLFLPPRRFIEVVDAVSDGSTGTFIANNLGGVKRLGLLEFLGGFQGELERYRYGYNQVLNNFLTGFYDKFHAIFGIYRVSGGYPRIFFQAAESTLKGSLNIEDRLYSEDIYQIFLDDARVLGLNYEELLNIIRRINNPVMEISKDFATLNPNSMKLTLLKKYLSYMQLSGLFGFLKRVSSKEDINYEDKVVTGSDGHPKLVVNDPSVFVAFYMRSRGAGPIFKKASDIIFENKKGFLLESIVISHAAYLPQRGRVPYDHVCYVLENNVSDSIPEKETTDILIWYLNHKNELIVIPVEVKSGVYHIEKIKINAKRLKEMGCGRLIVVVDSKIIDIQEDYVIVPIELFLALF